MTRVLSLRVLLGVTILFLAMAENWLDEAAAASDPNNLIGWWKLDDGSGTTAQDSSGYGNHGTLQGAPEWVDGEIGGALDFDGIDDYVAIQNLYYDSNHPEVTVCAWIRTSESGNQIIASYDRSDYWRLEINGTGAGAGQVGWDVMTDTGQVDLGSSMRVDDGQWHHVAGVFDNGTLTIYIDGSSDASASGGSTYGSGAVRYGFLGVGSEATSFDGNKSPTDYFNGDLDDVRIYNVALSDVEILHIRQAHLKFASSPDPADGAVNVMVEDVQLSWAAPTLLPETIYTVYFGSDPNDLPLIASDLAEPAVNVGALEIDTTYLWRVDVLDPNEGGTPVVNEGPIWSFTTAPATPVILVQPQPQMALVFAGETASFTIIAYSANSEPLTYAWFKETEPGTILSESDTLTITDAQINAVYKCTLTNAFGSITSEPVDLVIKRLVGHWPFDDNMDDIVADNDGTRGGGGDIYATGIVPLAGGTEPGSAVKFELGSNSNAVEIPTGDPCNLSLTLSFWEKADPDNISESSWEIMLASGAQSGYEILDAGRYAASRYYLGIMETPAGYDYPRDFVVSTRGQWHLIVITYDEVSEQAILYADGIPRIEFNADFTGFDELFFVGNSREDEYPYSGLIDDLRSYNYALDALEVAYLYSTVTGIKICMPRPDTDVSGPEGEPDCVVNIYDLVELVGAWLECHRMPAEDCL